MFKLIMRRVLRVAKMDHSFRDPFYIQQKLLASANPSTIFDVGAHHGKTAMQYALSFAGATVYCFEPFPKSFEVLKKVTSSCKNIRPYCFGIADSSGSRSFYINQMSATNSLLSRPRNLRRYYPSNAETVGQVNVEITTLDTFCKQSAISKIDILKMNIQGGELLALQGAMDLLSESLIDLIYTEVGSGITQTDSVTL